MPPGINPAYAYFGGEQVFLGKAGNRPAVGKAMQVISQGYRWFGIAACDFCQQPSDADGSQYNEWAPRAVLVRQWDFSFASGQPAKRTVGIFNNTRFADPLTFTWKLVLDGRTVADSSTVHAIPPGENEKFDVELPIPNSTQRLDGQWTLTLAAQDKELFRAVKDVSVLPAGGDQPKPPAVARLPAADLFVYDPKGTAAAFLRSHGIGFTPLANLDPPPAPGKVWLVGQDALTAADTSSTAFAAYAAGGGRVLLLEQDHPLRYQGLGPAEVEFQMNVGRTAFAEDVSHPLLRGLAGQGLLHLGTGRGGLQERLSQAAARRPVAGAVQRIAAELRPADRSRSTTGCSRSANWSSASRLADHPAAQTLLLERAGLQRRLQAGIPRRRRRRSSRRWPRCWTRSTCNTRRRAIRSQALTTGKIAVVSATPANLKRLAANAGQAAGSFTTPAAGWCCMV